MADLSEGPAELEGVSKPTDGIPDDSQLEAHGQGSPPEPPVLSKNQQKKLKRRQQWEDERPARKARRKEKRIEARERKRVGIRNGELPAAALKQVDDHAH